MRVRAIAATSVLCLLAACSQATVYPRPMSELHDALAAVDDLPPVFGSSVPDLVMETADPSAVSWIVTLDGSEVMRFVARLKPRSALATTMTLDLAGVTTGPRGNTEQRLEEHPEIRRLYLVSMQEQIDSTLERRPFDVTRTYGAVAAATAANIGAISRQIDRGADAARNREQQGE